MTTFIDLLAADPNVSSAFKAAAGVAHSTTFVHRDHLVAMTSKLSDRFGRLYSASIIGPDGQEVPWGLWFSLPANAERNVRDWIDQKIGAGK